MSYINNIREVTIANTNFRTVLFTGDRSQLVVMNIPIGDEIGEEAHPAVEQTIFILSGQASVTLDGEVTQNSAGDVIVVTPGVEHNLTNSGDEPLKLYTVYAPANHLDGRIHVTKQDADIDDDDERFGESDSA